ncbi:helical backbone metal receptor [Stackebrandtia soli]|uniref:helical backbone metal receptor n=1 Tax=Stackebrandtia soli TaxID=1892856 RepID=UPI0039ECD606
MRDDLGHPYDGERPRRIVSLVPSTTETVALIAPELLVGVTDYCSHPADLSAERVGGSKYPRVADVVALAPDLVLANAEENRREDVEALRAAGVDVWVSFPRTVIEACASAASMTAALRLPRPEWVDEAAALWAEPVPRWANAVVPIWRRPWMVLGSATFSGDVLRRLGVDNVYAGSTEPYPKVPITELNDARPDLVVLPDEPYEFTSEDGPEAFPGIPCALVSGRHLTWHGPSLVEAHGVLRRQLAEAKRA